MGVIRSSRFRLEGHVARIGVVGIQTNFSRKSRREETTWGPRRKWEDNIKMGLKERGCGLDSSGLG